MTDSSNLFATTVSLGVGNGDLKVACKVLIVLIFESVK